MKCNVFHRLQHYLRFKNRQPLRSQWIQAKYQDAQFRLAYTVYINTFAYQFTCAFASLLKIKGWKAVDMPVYIWITKGNNLLRFCNGYCHIVKYEFCLSLFIKGTLVYPDLALWASTGAVRLKKKPWWK